MNENTQNGQGQSFEQYEASGECAKDTAAQQAKTPGTLRVKRAENSADYLSREKATAFVVSAAAKAASHGEPWTDVDDATLLELVAEKYAIGFIASRLGRSYWAIRQRRKVLFKAAV